MASITSGFAFKSKAFSDSGQIPLIRNRDVARGYSTTFYSGSYTEEFLVENGDLLVSMDGDFRAARWAGGRALLNQRVCRIDVATHILDPGFLRFLMPGKLKRIQDFTPYATVKHLSSKTIKAIRIPLPPLAEQRRIAAILDKADAIRRKRRESIKLLDDFLRSVFLEMIGDPVRNPQGWEVERLENVALLASGVTKGRKLRGSEILTVPYLRVANVQDGYLELADVKSIEATPKEIEQYGLQAEDIVLTEGGDPDKLGRGAVWRGEIEGCIHQNHIFRVRLPNGSLLPDYVCALLGSAYGKRYFLKAAKQTTGIATINRTQLGRFPVLMVPLDLQHHYAAMVKSVDELEQRLAEAETTTDQLFNSLAQRAFRGEL